MPFLDPAPFQRIQVTFRTSIASLALIALAPVAAAAQFTTFVAPPERVDTIVVTDTVVTPVADSATAVANMKAWVDSAAGAAVDLDSVGTTAPGDVFPDGLPAPDTATPLPLLLTLGAGAIGAGVVLLRRR